MEKSILGKYWSPRSYNENFALEISRTLNISDFLAKLLSRHVQTIDEAINFFNPKLKSLLPDPFHLKDMHLAVERVMRAIIKREKICIYADYDVDGATSAALLKNLFNHLGANSIIYVPDRIKEGYGPTPFGMQEIKKQGADLVITVDCGSVAFEAIEHAVQNNLEVIVIDHHISLETMPKALAVINPNRLDETSEYKNLAAVGVSFLFCIALCKHLNENKFFSKNNLDFPDLMKQLDLVALGTVCDVMSITGLNRAFVSQGLKVAKYRENIGYKALCDIAVIDEAPNIYHLGYIIGPRINAGGRVGKSDLGARILSTKSELEAQKIALELNSYNEERKAIEVLMLESAEEMAQMQLNEPALFIVGEGWHQGVIGIIAGRLKEKYNKPVAVIALNDGIGKASCRSIKNIDFGCKILQAKQQNLVISGGGHAMAAGFTVEAKKIDQLKIFLFNEFKKDIKDSNAHLHESYDLELATSAATIELVEQINKLEPYGVGNPAPIFKFSNVYVLKADIVGLKHIRILFAPTRETLSTKPLAAIAFNAVGSEMGNIIMAPKPHKLSVFGKLKINSWQNKDNVQLMLQDINIEK